MWVVPYTSSIVEIMYRKVAKKIIYDMEDNILIIPKNEIESGRYNFNTLKLCIIEWFNNNVRKHSL